MKKYFLALFFTILCCQLNYADGPPGPPGCECCAGAPDEAACLTACGSHEGPGPYCDDLVPIDSNILFLFALAVSFGSYSVYKGKLGVAIRE
jgi:hypothetical protein